MQFGFSYHLKVPMLASVSANTAQQWHFRHMTMLGVLASASSDNDLC